MKMVFAQRLKQVMEYKEIRQADLAKWTGLSQGMISQYLSGMSVPRGDNLQKIAYVVGASPGWLMGYDNVQTGADGIMMLYTALSEDGKQKVYEYAEMLLAKERKDVQG